MALDPESKEYQNASKRIGLFAEKPFLIEPFCAELAWLAFKMCPLYPFREKSEYTKELYDTDDICKYLTSDEYPEYRCPMASALSTFCDTIVEQGTPEQKDALEHLADMFVRYATMENPPMHPADRCLDDAWIIYKLLGKEEKLEPIKEFRLKEALKHPNVKNAYYKEDNVLICELIETGR